MSENEATESSLLELTSGIISAYLANNAIDAAKLPHLILSIHSTLLGLDSKQAAVGRGLGPEEQRRQPTKSQIRSSIGQDRIISFEDGRPYSSLRRHLKKAGLTPEEYRVRWGLPFDYPMVAPGYSARRSELAKSSGLGRKRAAAPPKVRARNQK